jgi:hypothetical protein
MRTGNEKAGAAQDPEQAIAGFIQAPAFIEIRDPARERADISPRWRA